LTRARTTGGRSFLTAVLHHAKEVSDRRGTRRKNIDTKSNPGDQEWSPLTRARTTGGRSFLTAVLRKAKNI
jgi:hypothetical protein